MVSAENNVTNRSRERIIRVTDWVLPPNFLRLLSYYRWSAAWFALTHRDVLRGNRRLHNRHQGQRCFVLCNGPSVKEQDIRPLRNEVVFSVSNGYKHPDYSVIRPRYHCLPQLTYIKLTRELAIKWFDEMHASIGDAELFLDQQEWGLVRDNRLFEGRQVNFVCMAENYFPRQPRNIPSLDGMIPRVQTVPILVIMIALYMGFRQIYLLGTDHDWFVKREYRYFFEPDLLKGLDLHVAADGKLETTLWDELPEIRRIWSEYRALKMIAANAGATIYNATHGGMLDEFERVRLEDVLSGNGRSGA